MPYQDLIVIFVALFVGGTMKSATGMGLPVIGIPVLTAYSSLPFAIAVILIPTVLSNAWQVWRYRNERTPRYLAIAIFVGASIGTVLGVTVLASLSSRWLNLGVALVVTVFLVSRVVRPDWHLSERMARRLAFPVSTTAGLLQGATGISSPVVVMFLSSIGLDRGSFIFSVSLIFLVSGMAQVPSMIVAGLLGTHQILGSALALAPIAAGMWFGERLGRFLSLELFNRLIMGILVLLVIKLFWSVVA